MTSRDETNTRRRRKFRISYVIIGLLVATIAGVTIFRLRARSKLESRLEAIRAAGYRITLL